MSRTQILAILAGALIGVAVGIGGYTFAYAKGASYCPGSGEPDALGSHGLSIEHSRHRPPR